jgi:hypothetical protein
LRQIFAAIGYQERGKDYLAEKQNDFLWMAEAGCEQLPAMDALPQVVIADFRLDAMPATIQAIIQHYSQQTSPAPLERIQQLIQRITKGDENAVTPCANLILTYFHGRDWPLPTIQEFHTVQEFNELLAWVLLFGRRPNHFTLSVHLLDYFKNLTEFNQFIEEDADLALNQEGGVLKGGLAAGIAQSSTMGIPQTIRLADGNIDIPLGFIEFVWRYPQSATKPQYWGEYFTGFIGQHANRVIESLYN